MTSAARVGQPPIVTAAAVELGEAVATVVDAGTLPGSHSSVVDATSGNLRFRRTARNFNPNVAMAGKITVVEVEKIVEKGAIDPDDVHLPGIFVHRIVLNATPEKRIEQRTTRKA